MFSRINWQTYLDIGVHTGDYLRFIEGRLLTNEKVGSRRDFI